jgi:hypothetical protein
MVAYCEIAISISQQFLRRSIAFKVEEGDKKEA